MSATSIGLPKLKIAFEKAAQATANRAKKGYVGMIVRDAKAQGLHKLVSDTMIPTELGVDNQALVKLAFEGSDRGGPSLVYLVVIATGTEDTTALEGGLKLLESVSVDYLAGPADVTEDELEVLNEWVKAQRAAYRTVKLVRPFQTTGSDDMGIIEVDETGMKDASGSLTAAKYCARFAGIFAGLPMGMSAPYAALPELTAVTARSETEQTTAINAGKLILLHDGQKAKIARAVNSLTTIPVNGNEDWRKVKIVEGMDLITYYLRTTIQGQYIGRYPNTYDNKCLLLTAIREYFAYLESAGVLNPGESWAEIDLEAQERWLKAQGVETADLTEQQLKEYQTGSWVFIKCGGRLVDAMEDFQVIFHAAATLAT